MFEFIDPRTTPFVDLKSRGELPHLYKDGGSYFVTFRLFDAVEPRRKIPTSARRRGATETAAPPEETRRRRAPSLDVAAVGQRSESPLRFGSCLLAQPEIAELTQNALRHFHGERYCLSAWCVMPNHVHTVVTPLDDWELPSILHSWKSFTSHRANKLLKRQGSLWERESFDHLIRSPEHFEYFIQYVEDNPVKAGLCQIPEDWPWSSAHFRVCNEEKARETRAL